MSSTTNNPDITVGIKNSTTLQELTKQDSPVLQESPNLNILYSTEKPSKLQTAASGIYQKLESSILPQLMITAAVVGTYKYVSEKIAQDPSAEQDISKKLAKIQLDQIVISTIIQSAITAYTEIAAPLIETISSIPQELMGAKHELPRALTLPYTQKDLKTLIARFSSPNMKSGANHLPHSQIKKALEQLQHDKKAHQNIQDWIYKHIGNWLSESGINTAFPYFSTHKNKIPDHIQVVSIAGASVPGLIFIHIIQAISAYFYPSQVGQIGYSQKEIPTFRQNMYSGMAKMKQVLSLNAWKKTLGELIVGTGSIFTVKTLWETPKALIENQTGTSDSDWVNGMLGGIRSTLHIALKTHTLAYGAQHIWGDAEKNRAEDQKRIHTLMGTQNQNFQTIKDKLRAYTEKKLEEIKAHQALIANKLRGYNRPNSEVVVEEHTKDLTLNWYIGYEHIRLQFETIQRQIAGLSIENTKKFEQQLSVIVENLKKLDDHFLNPLQNMLRSAGLVKNHNAIHLDLIGDLESAITESQQVNTVSMDVPTAPIFDPDSRTVYIPLKVLGNNNNNLRPTSPAQKTRRQTHTERAVSPILPIVSTVIVIPEDIPLKILHGQLVRQNSAASGRSVGSSVYI